jgi:hypothetical protein
VEQVALAHVLHAAHPDPAPATRFAGVGEAALDVLTVVLTRFPEPRALP